MKEASDKDVVEEKNRTTMEWIHSGYSGALNRTYTYINAYYKTVLKDFKMELLLCYYVTQCPVCTGTPHMCEPRTYRSMIRT